MPTVGPREGLQWQLAIAGGCGGHLWGSLHSVGLHGEVPDMEIPM